MPNIYFSEKELNLLHDIIPDCPELDGDNGEDTKTYEKLRNKINTAFWKMKGK